MNIDRIDRKDSTQMKVQAGIAEERTEEAMELKEQDSMVTETHEDTAKRFHAWGNL